MGGRWSSADLDERAVASIRELVGERVYRLEGAGRRFPIGRSTRWWSWTTWSTSPTMPPSRASWHGSFGPAASVIINVPHLKPAS